MHISVMQGKTAVPVNELHAGDIGAVAKLKDTLTGDTLEDLLDRALRETPTPDVGGTATTSDFGDAVLAAL